MANIELDGVNKKIKVDSGDLTLDVPGDIVLDADGGDVVFADGGTNLLKVTNSSSDVVLQPQVDTKDIVFKQYDGTVVATVEDNATFNIPTDKLAINGTAVTSTAAELNILDGVTSTTAELNILDGVTSTAAELNIVDGNTSATSTTIADADRVVLNDNGTMVQAAVTDLKTYIGGGDNTPMFSVRQTGTVNVSDNTYTKVAWNSELVDTDNAFASDKFTVPSGKSGKYFLYTMLLGQGASDNTLRVYYLNIYKNGSRIAMNEGDYRSSTIRKATQTVTTVQDLSEGDYIEVYVGIDVNSSIQASYSGGDYQGMFGGYKLIT